jgi:pyruvate ferredoxin oxidoreductase delta subunit
MSKYDELKDWKKQSVAGMIFEAGNSESYETGSWRTYRPEWDKDKCISCLRCFYLCPDSAIKVEEGKVIGIDYLHCKGCGICAFECPKKVQAITMKLDSKTAEKK